MPLLSKQSLWQAYWCAVSTQGMAFKQNGLILVLGRQEYPSAFLHSPVRAGSVSPLTLGLTHF